MEDNNFVVFSGGFSRAEPVKRDIFKESETSQNHAHDAAVRQTVMKKQRLEVGQSDADNLTTPIMEWERVKDASATFTRARSSYFNYGLNENSFKDWIKSILELRVHRASRRKIETYDTSESSYRNPHFSTTYNHVVSDDYAVDLQRAQGGSELA